MTFPGFAEINVSPTDYVICISGIYKHLLSDKKFGLTHNLIATKVMPPLIPQTVNPGLSMEQVTVTLYNYPSRSLVVTFRPGSSFSVK